MWEGLINEMNEAFSRLVIIVPLTLVIISLLVYRAVGNWLDLVIILIDIPVACTGGVLALLHHRDQLLGLRRRWASSPSSASRCRTRC